MIIVADTACKVIQKVNGYLDPTLGIEDIGGIFKGLYLRYKNQVNAKSSSEVLRFMHLGFLGSFRWNSATSTQHFEMMDTVDVRAWKLVCSGSIFCQIWCL